MKDKRALQWPYYISQVWRAYSGVRLCRCEVIHWNPVSCHSDVQKKVLREGVTKSDRALNVAAGDVHRLQAEMRWPAALES